MLSRVAENLYWIGRKLERAENTSRLVLATSQVLIEASPGVILGWADLLRIMGLQEHAGLRYVSESQVIQLLIMEEDNQGAILLSLGHARENARTLREVLPREVWMELNELFMFARKELRSGLPPVEREQLLRSVIRRRLGIAGMLSENMSHDAAFQFIRLGEMLERADMTSRILDLTTVTNSEDIGATAVWLHVLGALSADQMYRRHVAMQITPAQVLRFLINDTRFPRSLRYALHSVEGALGNLPEPQEPLRALRAAERLIAKPAEAGAPLRLRAQLDNFQMHLAAIHTAVAERYFHRAAGAGAQLQDVAQLAIQE